MVYFAVLSGWIDLAKYYPIIIERDEKVVLQNKEIAGTTYNYRLYFAKYRFKTFNVFHIPNNMSYATEARILKIESIVINVSHKF